jgi:hypothetical protein
MDPRKYRTGPSLSTQLDKSGKVFRQVQTIHESQEALDEVDRYLDKTGKSAGKAYVEAMQLLIAREKKAGRYQ